MVGTDSVNFIIRAIFSTRSFRRNVHWNIYSNWYSHFHFASHRRRYRSPHSQAPRSQADRSNRVIPSREGRQQRKEVIWWKGYLKTCVSFFCARYCGVLPSVGAFCGGFCSNRILTSMYLYMFWWYWSALFPRSCYCVAIHLHGCLLRYSLV